MFCSVLSAEIYGVETVPVRVEADVSDGFPSFSIVGSVGTQVREAQERVRTALRNTGIRLPPKRITINLSPGNLRKEGTRFDLPIAVAILSAMERIPAASPEGLLFLGELHLDGSIGAVPGVLPSLLLAREAGCSGCVIPASNRFEGRAVPDMQVVGVKNLQELLDYLKAGSLPDWQEETAGEESAYTEKVDFSQIRGQEAVKRVAVIAASGFHNLMLSGPPGSGKSMAARRIPTILPPLTEKERLEISGIYSIAGRLPKSSPLLHMRPFRSPHHTISPAALCGGGRIPHPGEITLAHRGVLFLDELPEMRLSTLELLRQPLEDRRITISRLDCSVSFPAEFLLAAAMNPCPCGYYPDRNRCTCTQQMIRKYRQKLSGPILDRIDLRCDVQEVGYRDLKGGGEDAVSSAVMQQQVMHAAEIQKERYSRESWLFNSELPSDALDRYCPLTDEGERLLSRAFSSLGLSARGYHRILKLSRTIADLDNEERIRADHISEAITYRSTGQNG
ncbi:MAG: YifB family Mg chelatase-like AAA ATPase [Lachnospiraceae bacterium]|nr:YifB family Mg chelatase-like AAA ATPase [Lachnospiraceae bacterium]